MSQLLERDPTGPLGATPILVERAFSTESGGSRSTLARVSVGAVSSSRCAPVCASERHAQEVSSGCARRRGSGSLASLEWIVEIHQQVARLLHHADAVGAAPAVGVLEPASAD